MMAACKNTARQALKSTQRVQKTALILAASVGSSGWFYDDTVASGAQCTNIVHMRVHMRDASRCLRL